MRGKIIRIDKSQDGVFGVLTLNNQVICLTLERPWLDNKPDVSCIPPDLYLCARVESYRHGNTFEFVDVPARTNILFHTGNTIKDSRGCILLGSKYGKLGDRRAILESTTAFNLFMAKFEGIDAFPLQIINL